MEGHATNQPVHVTVQRAMVEFPVKVSSFMACGNLDHVAIFNSDRGMVPVLKSCCADTHRTRMYLI